MSFAISFVGTLGALSSLWLALFYLQIGNPTTQSKWVFEVYQKKFRIVDATPGQRILIVAGSGALFGIDSRRLAAEAQRPVVNLGVNAGLGLPYILWTAKQVARQGDIILLPLEYALYINSGEPSAQTIDYVLARDRAYWASLSIYEKARYAVALRPDRLVEGLWGKVVSRDGGGLYGVHNVDDIGDQLGTARENHSDSYRAELVKLQVWRYGARLRRHKGHFSKLTEFAVWAEQADICLIATPPSFMFRDDYAFDQVEADFYKKLPMHVVEAGIPFVGQPMEFMYPPDWFFNTDYHLLDWARDLHTKRLAAVVTPRLREVCRLPK